MQRFSQGEAVRLHHQSACRETNKREVTTLVIVHTFPMSRTHPRLLWLPLKDFFTMTAGVFVSHDK